MRVITRRAFNFLLISSKLTLNIESMVMVGGDVMRRETTTSLNTLISGFR